MTLSCGVLFSVTKTSTTIQCPVDRENIVPLSFALWKLSNLRKVDGSTRPHYLGCSGVVKSMVRYKENQNFLDPTNFTTRKTELTWCKHILEAS